MEITSAVVYKPQLQTALEKKTADVFCKNLKKRSGVSLLQSKTSGKISIEFYKEDSCSEEIKALFDGITVPGKEGFRIRVIDSPRIWRCSEQTPSSCFRRRRTTVCIPHFSRKIRWS